LERSIRLLGLERVHSGYGQVKILVDVSLEVKDGEIVSLIGANGAGKSTLLKSISGVVRCREGRILFDGKDLAKLPPHKVVEMGVIQVPEGRQVIGELTVRENLFLGCYVKHTRLGRNGRRKLLDSVSAIFPILRERMGQMAGTLSGGEQQMLAIGRALMAEPRLLLTDEPSLGLAPMIVESVCQVLLKLNRDGLTILLVEQNALIALEMAQRAYVLEGGRITLHGSSSELLHDDKVRESYLGV
jgi:branched-chain amino acid transport system ATP-binding protein